MIFKKTERRYKMKRLLFILAAGTSLLVSPALLTGTVFAQDEKPAAESTANDNSETYKELSLFGEVFERVRSQYVEKLTDKEIIEHALNGMLSSLDPHSSYMNEDSFNDMKVETKGAFGGLGIEVTMEAGFVKVVSPIDDTPAYKAGVQAGDYIVKIDGESVLGMDLSDAVDKMRGKVGEPIDIEIRREGADGPLNFKIVRDIIKIKSVKYNVEGNAGYIRVTTFNQNTGEGVRLAIEDLKKQLGDKITGFVVDLRNNPGGLLSQAIEVSDAFLDKGEIVSTRGRDENDTERDNATPGDLADGLPVVVLINGGSASASEIVSGALQDHKRGIIMGTKSFGKGSVQTVIPLPGNGAMRLTTARYYTPSGRSIQALGIEPDIIVEQAKLELLHAENISEADLKGAISNPQKEEKDKTFLENLRKENGAKDDEDKKDKPYDYQLERAVDLLTGLSLYTKDAPSAPAPEKSEVKK